MPRVFRRQSTEHTVCSVMRSSAAFTIGLGDKRTVRLLGTLPLHPAARATSGGNQTNRAQRPIRPETLIQVHASTPAIKDSNVAVGPTVPIRQGAPPQTPANLRDINSRDQANSDHGLTELLAPRRIPTSVRVINGGSVLSETPVPTRPEVIPPIPTDPRTSNKGNQEVRTRRPTAMEPQSIPTSRESAMHRLLQLPPSYSLNSAESAVPSGLQRCSLSRFLVCRPQ